MSPRKVTIAIAPDSFKGSLTALEAASCIERGLKRALVNVSTRKIPMADGGDGTVQAMVEATHGRFITRRVRNARGMRRAATFGITGDSKTAVIEMAAASGLAKLPARDRNPMVTTTYGTGELIRHALDLKVSRFIVGIGGSATNDGGAGMARALGVVFRDKQGRVLSEGGGALQSLAHIDMSGLDPRISGVEIDVACDVDNPLTGPHGAARVYGPQKGATPDMVKKLDAGLRRFARVVKKDVGVDILEVPGSGAAGGLGGGLMAFLGGRLRSGIDIVIDAVCLSRRLRGCDLVITGEGKMDGQTAFGKAPAGVAREAVKLGIPVIAIAGAVGKDAHRVLTVGIDSYFSALREPVEEERLREVGPEMLEECAEQVGRLIALRFRGRSSLRIRR